jgi:predicted transcriptional regulator
MDDLPDTATSRRYLTAQIVKAYVSNNHVPRDDLPTLIGIIYDALNLDHPTETNQPEAAPLVPAVPIKKSITPDYLICLEDGKSFKSLKRHLMTHYDLTPEAYRQKWGLPADYPMVAANYAAKRSELAKSIGLGRKAAASEPVEEVAPDPQAEPEVAAEAPKRRAGRKAKAEA